MKTPWLVQRCELENGKLMYDYMGATQFEVGDQAESLERLFAGGVTLEVVTVKIDDKFVPVYMLGALGFDFAGYLQYLGQMARGELRLKESTYFGDVIRVKLGLPDLMRRKPRTNVWFDFKNDVLWTLSEEIQDELVKVLEGIKASWKAKDAEK